jgi:hypothetical protein
MKRLTLIAVLTSAAALAGSRSETTTYVDGNLTGVSPNTGGTLVLSDEKTMVLRTGLENTSVAYEKISKVELGAVKETAHDVPLYKIWALHKRFSGSNKTETQLLIVNFKNDDGEDKFMTLELAKPAVDGVLATINKQTGKDWVPEQKTQTASLKKRSLKHTEVADETPKKSDGWWGDDYWKTTRNADKWNNAADKSADKPADKPASNDKQ